MTRKYIHQGILPDVFGYGLESFAYTEDEARKLLKQEYFKWRKEYNTLILTFEQAMEDFGGRIRKIRLGTCGAENNFDALDS